MYFEIQCHCTLNRLLCDITCICTRNTHSSWDSLYCDHFVAVAWSQTWSISEVCLYISDNESLSHTWFARMFSHSIVCLFTLLIVSVVVQKLLPWMQSHLSIFVLVACTGSVTSKKKNHRPD